MSKRGMRAGREERRERRERREKRETRGNSRDLSGVDSDMSVGVIGGVKHSIGDEHDSSDLGQASAA